MSRVLMETKKMSPIAAKEMLYQLYDVSFNIFDYINQKREESIHNNAARARPLSSVALHPAEDMSGSNNRFGSLAKVFIEYKMASILGCSLMEFLNLPVADVTTLVNIARGNAESATREQTEVLAEMDASFSIKK